MLSSGWSRFAHRFAKYYRSAELWIPPRIKLREWMFIPFGGAPPIRHKGFSDIESVRDFLSKRSMHSCFYSTAYWERPFELKMVEKKWLGADLIFDLDGDHLPGVTDRDFPGMLEVIRDQAWTLWNDYLQPEFGFDEKFLQVTFSGHRGYHLHYRDPSLFHLDSGARRELVSHIRGEGVDVKGGLARFHDSSSSGWSNRIRDGMETMVEKLQNISLQGESYKADLNELHEGLKAQSKREGRSSTKGIVSIQKLSKLLEDPRRSSRLLDGHFGVLDKYESLFLDLLKTDSSVILGSAGETDEVVTIDVRRQIRWPTSLHGKSGMRVSEFPLSRLDPDCSNPYDPLTEALALGTDDSIKVEMVQDECIFEFLGNRTEASSGDIFEIHEAGATFLVLKGWAKIVN